MKSKHKLPPWLRQKRSFGTSVAVGWYTEEEWKKVKASAVDPERFDESYTEWVQAAEQTVAELRAVGVNAEKCNVVAAKLLAWCLMHNKSNNGAARAQFISEQGRQVS
jgi:hypothetical protein